jgi:hypothetical protein
MKRMSGKQRSEKEENIEGLNLTVENKEKEDNMCNRQRMWKNRKKERKGGKQEELGGG